MLPPPRLLASMMVKPRILVMLFIKLKFACKIFDSARRSISICMMFGPKRNGQLSCHQHHTLSLAQSLSSTETSEVNSVRHYDIIRGSKWKERPRSPSRRRSAVTCPPSSQTSQDNRSLGTNEVIYSGSTSLSYLWSSFLPPTDTMDP